MNIFKDKNTSNSNINHLDKIIDSWAESISNEISERKFINIKEFKSFAKVRLFQSISDCIKIDIENLEDKRISLIDKVKTSKGKARNIMQTKLLKVNLEKKRANRLKHSLRDYNEYKQLSSYIKQRYGWDVMKDFYDNYLDKPKNMKNKTQPISKEQQSILQLISSGLDQNWHIAAAQLPNLSQPLSSKSIRKCILNNIKRTADFHKSFHQFDEEDKYDMLSVAYHFRDKPILKMQFYIYHNEDKTEIYQCNFKEGLGGYDEHYADLSFKHGFTLENAISGRLEDYYQEVIWMIKIKVMNIWKTTLKQYQS